MIAFSTHLLSSARRHELHREQRIRSSLKAVGFVLALAVAMWGGWRGGRMQALEECTAVPASLVQATERTTEKLQAMLVELGLWVYGVQYVRAE